MKIEYTDIQVRPSLDVSFHTPNETILEEKKLANKVHSDSGNLLYVISTLSDDNLTKTRRRGFKEQAALDAWLADPDVTNNWDNRDAYNTANGITMTTSTQEVE